jgi:YVTN family beta-propeller protein
MSTLLLYDITTDPFPLQASSAGGDPSIAQVTIVASNPTPANPVTLKGLVITFPVGIAASDLTSQSTGIGPIPPNGWTLEDTDTSPTSVKYIFYPGTGNGQVGSEGIAFIFNNVELNSQAGTVEIEVMEGSNDCKPPDCPTQNLQITKFPNGWGQVTYWTNPSPPIVPYDSGITLNWSGPSGATYTIEYYTPQTGAVNVPATGAPALSNEGQYPGNNDPQLLLTSDTVFYLKVVETISGQTYSAQQQITATIELPLPTIKLFTGEFQWTGDSLALVLKWDTENATSCAITGDAHPVNNSSSDDSYQIQPTPAKPLLTFYTLTATNEVGSSTSQITIEWGTSPSSAYAGGGSRGVAISPDNTQIMVANDNDRTLAVLDAVTLKPIKTVPAGLNYASYVAVSSDQSRIFVTNWMAGTITILDGSTFATIGTFPFGGDPLGIAISPDRTHVLVGDWLHSTVSVRDAVTLQPAGASAGLPEQCANVAISPDNTRVFVANTANNSVLVLDAGTLQSIAQVSVGNGPCDVTVSRDNALVFVPNVIDNTITVLDFSTLKQVGQFSAGTPTGIVMSLDNIRLYVTNCDDGTVSIIVPSGVTGGTPAMVGTS